jgi:hypothetical protein
VALALDRLVANGGEGVDEVLSEGVVRAVLTVPELEVVVVERVRHDEETLVLVLLALLRRANDPVREVVGVVVGPVEELEAGKTRTSAQAQRRGKKANSPFLLVNLLDERNRVLRRTSVVPADRATSTGRGSLERVDGLADPLLLLFRRHEGVRLPSVAVGRDLVSAAASRK